MELEEDDEEEVAAAEATEVELAAVEESSACVQLCERVSQLEQAEPKLTEDELEGCCKAAMFSIELVVAATSSEEDEVFSTGA